jgi:serine/threonine-protein kinase
MICPHCSIAEVSEETDRCELCGASPSDTTVATVSTIDDLRERFQKELRGQFRIHDHLAHARQLVLYAAEDVARQRPVVLRIIPFPQGMDPDLVQRFEDEAARAVLLEHHHLVPILRYGTASTFLWDAMEYPPGRPLTEIIQESGPMDLETCLKIVSQVTSALDYLHARGTEHGSLNLTSIFADAQQSVRVVLASPAHNLGHPGHGGGGNGGKGAPETSPDELRAGRVDTSADQYALAMMVYQCLTGTLLEESPAETTQHSTEALPRLTEIRKDIPSHVADAVEKAMSEGRAARFPSVHDFAAMLCRGWLPLRTSPAASDDRSAGAPRLVFDEATPEQRFPFRTVAVGAIGVLAIAAVVGSLMRPEEHEPTLPPMVQQPPTLRRPAAPVPASSETSPPEGATVQGDRAQRATRPTAGPGRLFVNATPWGQLYIDGRLIGNTPKLNLPLGPGTHIIRVERFGFEPYARRIEVAPGQEIRMTDIVLQPRQR